MIKRVFKKYVIGDQKQRNDDLHYWLSRPPEERIAAVEHLRRQYYGNLVDLPIQKTVRVIQLKQKL